MRQLLIVAMMFLFLSENGFCITPPVSLIAFKTFLYSSFASDDEARAAAHGLLINLSTKIRVEKNKITNTQEIYKINSDNQLEINTQIFQIAQTIDYELGTEIQKDSKKTRNLKVFLEEAESMVVGNAQLERDYINNDKAETPLLLATIIPIGWGAIRMDIALHLANHFDRTLGGPSPMHDVFTSPHGILSQAMIYAPMAVYYLTTKFLKKYPLGRSRPLELDELDSTTKQNIEEVRLKWCTGTLGGFRHG